MLPESMVQIVLKYKNGPDFPPQCQLPLFLESVTDYFVCVCESECMCVNTGEVVALEFVVSNNNGAEDVR